MVIEYLYAMIFSVFDLYILDKDITTVYKRFAKEDNNVITLFTGYHPSWVCSVCRYCLICSILKLFF